MRLELFNRRYDVFKNIKEIFKKIRKYDEIDDKDLATYYVELIESKFFFDDDIMEFIDEIKDNAIELNGCTRDLNNKSHYPMRTPERKEKFDEQTKYKTWFINNTKRIEEIFDKYLNFKNL